MSSISYLDFLTTVGAFGCLSFSLSGIGVKLGKYSSSPYSLGFKYINDSLKKDELYEATIKANASSWAKDKKTLEEWCRNHQRSPRHWEKASQYCLIKNNVWHKLIENSINLKKDIPKTAEKPN